MSLETLSEAACFGGTQSVHRHDSEATGTAMEFSVYLPPGAGDGSKVPVLFWLSGLTCTWENFTVKAGAQRYAAEHGIAIVAPDTSPRGDDVPDSSDEYDFGKGAGFYVNATREPWSKNYHMERYAAEELPATVFDAFPVNPDRAGVFGHSMGGHGALTLAMKNPGLFKSVSAFAPIVSPMNCPWGDKALGRYIGDDRTAWARYDACALVESDGWAGEILVDQGDADGFLAEQLKPELLTAACEKAGVPLTLRMQPGYDHSYYFIASFIGDHIAWHRERI